MGCELFFKGKDVINCCRSGALAAIILKLHGVIIAVGAAPSPRYLSVCSEIWNIAARAPLLQLYQTPGQSIRDRVACRYTRTY